MIRLAARLFGRDLRSGELYLLAAAIVVAVASLASVGFLADRVAGALERDVNRLLGGDLVLAADAPWDDSVRHRASEAGLETAGSTSLISMVRLGDLAQLAAVKAVSANWPLRGELRATLAEGSADEARTHGPVPGEAWIEPRLLGLLGVSIGDRIEIGRRSLRVSALVTAEPDRGAGFMEMAPRVLIAAEDLPGTGLVQAGSRARWRLYLAGDPAAIARVRGELAPVLARGQSIQGVDNARPEVRAALDRAQRFLGLAALLSALLAGVAVGLAARRHALRHRDAWALMRCLGASANRLFVLALLQLIALALASTLIGCLLAWGVQALLAQVIEQLGATTLPPPGLQPLVQATLLAVLLLAGGALPPVLQLRSTPALRVIRRDAQGANHGPLLVAGAGVAAFIGAVLWQARDLRLALWMVGGLGAGLGLMALLGLALPVLLRTLLRQPSLAWRQALRNLVRHRAATTLQMVALCVGITAILMLAFTRADLLEGWRARVPADAPDRFILNVQPEQRSAVDQFLREAGFATSVWYPMIRGRLTAINGRAVSAADYTDERARRLVEREFNLSWTDELPPGNTLAQGRWQDAGLDPQGGFSVEEGLARTLGIVLGDQLGWSVAGQAVSGRVTSLRRLHWDSMQVNFFVLSGPALLGASPPTWITAVHLGAGADRAVGRLLREQPNLTVVDTTALLAQLMSIIDRVSAAVRALFGFTLLAGVLVLASAATLLRDERLHEAAVMRALGASRAQLMRVAITEVLLLGALAGLMGALLASAAGWLLAVRVFEIVPRHDPAVWWAGPALGLACAAWLALSSARLASRGSPLAVLRAGN